MTLWYMVKLYGEYASMKHGKSSCSGQVIFDDPIAVGGGTLPPIFEVNTCAFRAAVTSDVGLKLQAEQESPVGFLERILCSWQLANWKLDEIGTSCFGSEQIQINYLR